MQDLKSAIPKKLNQMPNGGNEHPNMTHTSSLLGNCLSSPHPPTSALTCLHTDMPFLCAQPRICSLTGLSDAPWADEAQKEDLINEPKELNALLPIVSIMESTMWRRLGGG
jgi:hypothetical protein